VLGHDMCAACPLASDDSIVDVVLHTFVDAAPVTGDDGDGTFRSSSSGNRDGADNNRLRQDGNITIAVVYGQRTLCPNRLCWRAPCCCRRKRVQKGMLVQSLYGVAAGNSRIVLTLASYSRHAISAPSLSLRDCHRCPDACAATTTRGPESYERVGPHARKRCPTFKLTISDSPGAIRRRTDTEQRNISNICRMQR